MNVRGIACQDEICLAMQMIIINSFVEAQSATYPEQIVTAANCIY